MEIKISHKPVPYKEAMDFLEKKVEKVHADIEDEIIWILEHDSVYTKGISASDDDLLIPNLFPIIETNRGGKFTYHGPGQKIVYFVINLNKREKKLKNSCVMLKNGSLPFSMILIFHHLLILKI
jgi:lipoyl(octanoyl) transferase